MYWPLLIQLTIVNNCYYYPWASDVVFPYASNIYVHTCRLFIMLYIHWKIKHNKQQINFSISINKHWDPQKTCRSKYGLKTKCTYGAGTVNRTWALVQKWGWGWGWDWISLVGCRREGQALVQKLGWLLDGEVDVCRMIWLQEKSCMLHFFFSFLKIYCTSGTILLVVHNEVQGIFLKTSGLSCLLQRLTWLHVLDYCNWMEHWKMEVF